jgi:hypothetical protein
MLHLLPKVENQVGKVLAVALEVGGESPAVVTGGFWRGAYQDQLFRAFGLRPEPNLTGFLVFFDEVVMNSSDVQVLNFLL